MENMDNSYKLAPSPPSSPPGERKHRWGETLKFRTTSYPHFPHPPDRFNQGYKDAHPEHAVIHTINNMMMTIFLTLIFQKPCRIGGGRENHRKRLIFNGLAENWREVFDNTKDRIKIKRMNDKFYIRTFGWPSIQVLQYIKSFLVFFFW